MRIAVITAIFGDMETEKPFAPQSVDCDRYVFTPENSPFPLPNLPPRLQAKFFKLQAHHVLPNYDAYVWIDGNIEVTSPDFVKVMTENLSKPIRIQRHHERQTIGQEIESILNSDNPYLTARYGNQPLKQEYEYYLSRGMSAEALLYSCNIFSFLGMPPFSGKPDKFSGLVSERIFDLWWRLVLKWSWFDQSAFSFIAETMPDQVDVIDLGPMFDNPYFVLHPHDRWQQ